VCNFDCAYCIAKPRLAKRYGGRLFNTLKQVADYYKNDTLPDLQFSTGEFFARPDAGDICNYLAGLDCKVSMTTNASIYSEPFMNLIKTGKADYAVVSVDAGTSETFRKVKGRDAFSNVVSNLEKYSKEGLKIDLKYIFMQEINDNKKDIDGFIEAARRINPRSIVITTDTTANKERLPQKTINAILKLKDLAEENGIYSYYQLYHFNDKDVAIFG